MKSIPTMMDMTWEEVDRLVKENALVLMAVGIIEEHGPHLPLSTDLDLAMAQAEDVRQELECMGRKSVIAPPFFWGGAQALTRQFPGTFTSRAETIYQRPPRDSFDVHAGAYETAGMIEKYPEKVRREKMEGLLPTCLHDEQIGKWVQGEKEDRPLIPKGYCGDPAGALWMESDMTTADRVMARDIVSFLQKRNRME